MKHLKQILIVVIATSCSVEGVKTEKMKQSSSEGDTLETNESTSDNLELRDSSEMITDIDSIKVDTTSGNELELESGVKIKWLKKGKKEQVRQGKVVWVNYKGFLANGMMFDGDKAATQAVPLMVGVGMMVPGVEEALLKLRVGDYVKLLIPSDMGFGEEGYMNVPPNTDLLYEFAIREIQQPKVVAEGVKIWKVKETDYDGYKKDEDVNFHYLAYHKNGQLYFDSYRNKTPFQFKKGSNNIMKGLNIAFDYLKKGEMAFVELPSAVAYGSKGLEDLVPSNTDIIYYIKSVD